MTAVYLITNTTGWFHKDCYYQACHLQIAITRLATYRLLILGLPPTDCYYQACHLQIAITTLATYRFLLPGLPRTGI